MSYTDPESWDILELDVKGKTGVEGGGGGECEVDMIEVTRVCTRKVSETEDRSCEKEIFIYITIKDYVFFFFSLDNVFYVPGSK